MITLELTKLEALALFNAASAGVAALSIISTDEVSPFALQALQNTIDAVDNIGAAGWSAINDKMLIAMAIEDPTLPTARGELSF